MKQKLLVFAIATTAFIIVTTPAIATFPDIVIVFTDQQNFKAISCAGTAGIHTPNIDGLAAEGVRFTHAVCATPQCSPTRSALWTGRYPHRTGVMGNVSSRKEIPAGQSGPLDSEVPSIGKVFSAAGYETVYFGKWHLGNGERLNQHGFETYNTKIVRGRELTEQVVEYLQKRSNRSTALRPLLMIISYVNPHDIYHITRKPGPKVLERSGIHLPASWSDDLLTKPLPQRQFKHNDQGIALSHYAEQDWRRYISYYYQLTEGVDAEIGLVIKTLRQQSPGSLVVFTSDHGDLAGAHGLGFKGPMMYEELVRIPLIFSWPDKLKPSICNELVNHVDLLPTLCDLAGVKSPKEMDGMSMKPLLFAKTGEKIQWRDVVFSEYYGKQNWRAPIRMARTKTHKYIRYRKYGEELYDLTRDPHELNNLADSKNYQKIKKMLSHRLDEWMIKTKDPFNQLVPADKKLSIEQASQ